MPNKNWGGIASILQVKDYTARIIRVKKPREYNNSSGAEEKISG